MRQGSTTQSVKPRSAWSLAAVAFAILSFAVASSWIGPRQTHDSASAGTELLLRIGNQGLWFEPNLGQANDRVAFQAKGLGHAVYLTRDASAVLALSGNAVLRLHLVEAAGEPEAAGVNELSGVSNYLTGSEPTAWRSGVPHYGGVRYENV
jgi:hypothetical protein